MPKTVFKEGDVVEIESKDNKVVRPSLCKNKVGLRGIAVAHHIMTMILPTKKWVMVQWFDGTEKLQTSRTLKICEGVKNPEFCEQCKDRFKCYTEKRNFA